MAWTIIKTKLWSKWLWGGWKPTYSLVYPCKCTGWFTYCVCCDVDVPVLNLVVVLPGVFPAHKYPASSTCWGEGVSYPEMGAEHSVWSFGWWLPSAEPCRQLRLLLLVASSKRRRCFADAGRKFDQRRGICEVIQEADFRVECLDNTPPKAAASVGCVCKMRWDGWSDPTIMFCMSFEEKKFKYYLKKKKGLFWVVEQCF